MPRKPQNYYKNRERFQILSGITTAPHGEAMYGYLTGENDGTIMYKGGREVTVAQERSLEILGTKLSTSSTGNETGTNPAKLIKAENGDIILEAPLGKIILTAAQIEITATGNKVIDKTGGVFIKGNSSVSISAPAVKVKTSKFAVNASHTITLIGKNYIDTIAGFHNATTIGDGTNLCGGIFTKATTLKNTITSIIG